MTFVVGVENVRSYNESPGGKIQKNAFGEGRKLCFASPLEKKDYCDTFLQFNSLLPSFRFHIYRGIRLIRSMFLATKHVQRASSMNITGLLLLD